MKKLIILALIMLPMSAFAQKFAHVNSAVIINAMPEYTKARTDLEALAKQYEDELKRIQDEFRTKPDSRGRPVKAREHQTGRNLRESRQGNQGNRLSRRICLYHGRNLWHSIHQRNPQHRRNRPSQSQTRYQVSLQGLLSSCFMCVSRIWNEGSTIEP